MVTFVLVSLSNDRDHCLFCFVKAAADEQSVVQTRFIFVPPRVPRIRDDPSQPPLWVFASGEATQVNGILHSGQRMPRVGKIQSWLLSHSQAGINSIAPPQLTLIASFMVFASLLVRYSKNMHGPPSSILIPYGDGVNNVALLMAVS